MSQRVKIHVPETFFRSWCAGQRKVIVLPKNRTTRTIKWGTVIELNGHHGQSIVYIGSFLTVREAFRVLGNKFLSAQTEEEVVALWQRYVARNKPNCNVFAFHVVPT